MTKNNVSADVALSQHSWTYGPCIQYKPISNYMYKKANGFQKKAQRFKTPNYVEERSITESLILTSLWQASHLNKQWLDHTDIQVCFLLSNGSLWILSFRVDIKLRKLVIRCCTIVCVLSVWCTHGKPVIVPSVSM